MRLFAYRKAQMWPPQVIEQRGWAELYANIAASLPVLKNLDEAVLWVNELVSKIDNAC